MDRERATHADDAGVGIELNRHPAGRFVQLLVQQGDGANAVLGVLQAHAGGRRCEVHVEVKWSDNPDVTTAASKQLGPKYLLPTGSSTSHGILLVAWSGKGAGALDRAALEHEVRSDVALFNDTHPLHHVDVVFLDTVPGEEAPMGE